MYQAIVAKITTRKIEGMDNLLLGNVSGYNVLVSKETPENSLGIFFESGGQLSPEFSQANDLIRRKDAEGNAAGGYFEDNRRVKSIRMRGVISEGFFCSLETLNFTGANLSDYKEGDQFDTVNGIKICSKYFTLRTARAMRENQDRTAKRENKMFAKHIETGQFKREGQNIPVGSYIIITEKCHGSSHRMALVQEIAPIVPKNKLAAWWAKLTKQPDSVTEWKTLHGSRNVVLSDANPGYYGSHEFRYKATSGINLRKGEVIYGEIVGYTDEANLVMERQDVSKLKDKKIEKVFGSDMMYSYGCNAGEQKFFVYRITQVNEDGHAVELSWNQVLGRCRELALTPVPTMDTFIYDGDLESLSLRVGRLVGGESGMDALASVLDSSHVREGVVVRFESSQGTGFLKEKSKIFGLLEGYLKDREDFVDLEEAA